MSGFKFDTSQPRLSKTLKEYEELDTTFHDASYLHYAREIGLPLPSEDKTIIEKVRQTGIMTSTLTKI